MTFFSHHRFRSVTITYVLLNYALALVPLSPRSSTSPNLPIGTETHLWNKYRWHSIKGGGAALRCAPPHFDHWVWSYFWSLYLKGSKAVSGRVLECFLLHLCHKFVTICLTSCLQNHCHPLSKLVSLIIS